jgi:hypothetical protein
MQNTVELENVAQTLFGKILKFVYVIELFWYIDIKKII